MLEGITPEQLLLFDYLKNRKAWLEYLHIDLKTFALPQRIQEVFSDTSTDAFLLNLEKSLTALEIRSFAALAQNKVALTDLDQRAERFGRMLATQKIAKEIWLQKIFQEQSLNLAPLYSIAYSLFFGGPLLGRSILVRRNLPTELSYLIHSCPHEKAQTLPGDSKPDEQGVQLNCRLEALFFKGFVQTLFSGIAHQRFRDQKLNKCIEAWTQEESKRDETVSKEIAARAKGDLSISTD